MSFKFESGSFRDRNSRVFYKNNMLFRCLNEKALEEWETLSSTNFFTRFMGAGKLIPTERIEKPSQFDAKLDGDWAAILNHKLIPFISYPYEWPFGMLKEAALLQLELLIASLEENMILKDSSPFNFQWVGAKPVFIDIPSFERLRPGEAWVGYRQFCKLFLYPLFLQSYKDIPFHPWLRGSIDGIEPEYCNSLISLRDLFRPGVFTHVYLQHKLQVKYANAQKDVKGILNSVGFNKDLIRANVCRLKKVVSGLSWKRTKSEWSHYAKDNTYTDMDNEKKAAFVRSVSTSQKWNLVWDLGCNTGVFSKIAAESGSYVIAMDADHQAIDRLYEELKVERNGSILSLVNNLADPSPNLGWRGLERKSLPVRGKPDLILCLALLHHVVITANIPLKEFIEWIASLGASLVIEFVTKEDPMVTRLLQNKEDNYSDYEIMYFEQTLSEAFDVIRREELMFGMRILYFARSRK